MRRLERSARNRPIPLAMPPCERRAMFPTRRRWPMQRGRGRIRIADRSSPRWRGQSMASGARGTATGRRSLDRWGQGDRNEAEEERPMTMKSHVDPQPRIPLGVPLGPEESARGQSTSPASDQSHQGVPLWLLSHLRTPSCHQIRSVLKKARQLAKPGDLNRDRLRASIVGPGLVLGRHFLMD